jgi:hypothetical protein
MRELGIERARVMADQMGENLAFHPARQIGAGCWGSDEELRKIPSFDAHGIRSATRLVIAIMPLLPGRSSGL